jgi:SAM-dependent methyltransferase
MSSLPMLKSPKSPKNPKTQQQIWQEEHQTQSSLPSMANKKPTEGIIDLVQYFGPDWFKGKSIIDIGCGKGRNCVYLAQQGAQIFALDYIDQALKVAKDFAKEMKVENKINFICAQMDESWPFESDVFDLAIDSFSSIDVETQSGREKYRDELFRTLKPNGYALVLVVSCEDEFEKELIQNHPGSEPNSCIWPTNGKFQKDYSAEELTDFYSSAGFSIVELKKVEKRSFKMNRHFNAITFWCLIQKR